MEESIALGIDIGGTGIKAAHVDVAAGKLVSPRERVRTPRPATPESVGAAIKGLALAASRPHAGIAGMGFPGVIRLGTACTAPNLGKRWIGVNVEQLGEAAIGRPTAVVNDADAAGLAEARFGAARGVAGLVVLITLGTGIGTALMFDGKLVPNSELGHIKLRGKDAERRAAASVRERKGLSWSKWAAAVEEYIAALDRLLWPDLVVIGGGVSAEPGRFIPLIKVRPPVVPAVLGNDAGIIGAALWGWDALGATERAEPPTDL